MVTLVSERPILLACAIYVTYLQNPSKLYMKHTCLFPYLPPQKLGLLQTIFHHETYVLEKQYVHM